MAKIKWESMDEAMGSHFVLRIFFLGLSIIFIITALYSAIGFEEEYLNSNTSEAFQESAGNLSLVLIIIFIIYWILWIIYAILRSRMDLSEGDYET